jgi:hypothetical protein
MPSIRKIYCQFLNTDAGANLYNEFKKILYTEEDSLVQILDNEILQNLSLLRKPALKVCDIGGGDGKRIIRILRFIHAKFQEQFHLDFIEQSGLYINAFDTSGLDSFCETRKHHALFENVSLLEGSYDLIFLIHSIFAFEKGRALDKVLSLPHTNGKVIIVSNAQRSFLGGLKEIVDQGYDDRRYEIDDLRQDLDKKQIPYVCSAFQTRWAIDEAHHEDYLNIIMGWISLNSWRSFTQQKKRIILDYVAENTTSSEGRTFFKEEENVLVIPSL